MGFSDKFKGAFGGLFGSKSHKPVLSSWDFMLLQAAWHGDIETIIEAFKNDADCNARNYDGATPLIRAADKGNEEAVRYLVTKADLNAQDDEMDTALIVAVSRGHTGVARILITAGAALDLKDMDGHTALDLAKVLKRDEITAIIEEKLGSKNQGETKSILEREQERRSKRQLKDRWSLRG